MLYCVKSEPEPDSDSEPDFRPELTLDLESEPSVNSWLYTPDWNSIIYPCDQAEECTDVHHYNAEH